MKTNNIIKAMAAGILTLGLASCENTDVDFPDYQGGISVYFAYQTPVRAMMLGTDDLGSTADNDSRTCKIYGTMGGSYSGKNIKVEVAVDNSLCDNLYFDPACTQPVVPMPTNYYQLSGTTLDYAGDIKGGVDVKLTDAFFADPKACSVNYVIPVVMKSQTGADHILSGTYGPGIESGSRFDEGLWSVVPKDYVLYCVKYVSKFEGYYLPKGSIKTTINGSTSSKDYNYTDWERVPSGEIIYLQTVAENQVVLPFEAIGTKDVEVVGKDGNNQTVLLSRIFKGTAVLTFNGNECTASCNGTGTWSHQEWDDDAKETKTFTETIPMVVTGKGTYVEQSDKYLWGAKKRNGLAINFNAEFNCTEPAVYTVDLDMALQRRGQGNTVEEFTVTLKK